MSSHQLKLVLQTGLVALFAGITIVALELKYETLGYFSFGIAAILACNIATTTVYRRD